MVAAVRGGLTSVRTARPSTASGRCAASSPVIISATSLPGAGGHAQPEHAVPGRDHTFSDRGERSMIGMPSAGHRPPAAPLFLHRLAVGLVQVLPPPPSAQQFEPRAD